MLAAPPPSSALGGCYLHEVVPEVCCVSSSSVCAVLCCALLCSALLLQVSLTIRLAIGITDAQAGAGTDKVLAAWLAQPSNIRNAISLSGVRDPIGPYALIKWLLPPEIWVSPVSGLLSQGFVMSQCRTPLD
jgi:hypothetical protein